MSVDHIKDSPPSALSGVKSSLGITSLKMEPIARSFQYALGNWSTKFSGSSGRLKLYCRNCNSRKGSMTSSIRPEANMTYQQKPDSFRCLACKVVLLLEDHILFNLFFIWSHQNSSIVLDAYKCPCTVNNMTAHQCVKVNCSLSLVCKTLKT